MPEEHEGVETKSSDSPEVYKQTKFMAWFEKAFPWLLVSGATLGLTLMIILPIIFFQEKTGDQLKAQSDLRLALLYTTGGAIAALGLLETYRKNTNDRTKANADINATLKNQDHQTKVLKEQIRQFDENAFKERKAERRERYTKAVEQLGSQEPPVRMGGVYTLVGLVDEWLEEENLSEYERFKEGQVIINNLCSYIRSPYTLASRYDELSQDKPTGSYEDRAQAFYADKATLKSEADVRLGIIKEIHDRLRSPGGKDPGAWSDFEYDFSGSTFFYPVNLMYSYYTRPVNFSRSTFQDLASFLDSTYLIANFIGATFQKSASFCGSTYFVTAGFIGTTYQGEADFRGSIYKSQALFRSSVYNKEVLFGGGGSWPSGGSIYQGQTDFSNSIYQGQADFSKSIYQEEASFSDSVYQEEASFSGSIFYNDIYFGQDGDNGSFSRFTDCAPQFYDEKNRKNTLFDSPDNDFSVENGRGYPIYRNLEGLPLGCKFLSSEQKEYLADNFQEIEKINNKLREVKDPKEKAELSKKLQALTEELHEWREEATTVKVEDAAAEDTEN